MTQIPNKDKAYLSVSWPEDNAITSASVHAVTTLRAGGVSTGDFSEFNLAMHVGDEPQAVKINRSRLIEDLQLPAEPLWLEQVHSNSVVVADDLKKSAALPAVIQADASISRSRGLVCAVMTADCLPVFFCNLSGTEVAVAHAGWRGLHAGIIANTVAAMFSPVSEIMVSFGPAIGPDVFEVGEDIFSAFVEKDDLNRSAFTENRRGHYLCDIYQLARNELLSLGIEKISGGGYCTYSEDQLFYSYRKQKNTGRMASLIWIQ